MTTAICPRCGADKRLPLEPCGKCRWSPGSFDERVLAYALTDAWMSAIQLKMCAEDIRAHRKPIIPKIAMAEAARVVALDSGRADSPEPAASVQENEVTGRVPNTPIRRDAPAKTGLEGNAFAVLGATLRDDRKRLLELAEEKSLHGDEESCSAARAELSNPRTRLAAEIAWLPGAAPTRIQGLLAGLRQNPAIVRSSRGLPALPLANLVAAAIELVEPGQTAEEWSEWIVYLAQAEDAIISEDVLRDINEERAVAGFPTVQEAAAIEAALAERRQFYKGVMMGALSRVPSLVLVEALTKAVGQATAGGHNHAPLLIEELGAAYELQATEALEKGARGIVALVGDATEAIVDGETVLKSYIDEIDSLIRQWDAVAQPIQLLMKTRGLQHDASVTLANKIRSLAIEAVNEHDLIEQGTRLTDLLADVFAELPEVVERLDSDAEALQNLSRQREESAQSLREWEQAISYSAEIGTIFKDTLSISPNGVSWKGQSYPLKAVTRVRWGAVRHSVNGIPTGTTYTIAFGDSHGEAVCEMRNEPVWSEFVSRLWKAVGFRITMQMLAALGAGEKLWFGEAVVDDLGVAMPKHTFFGNSDAVYCLWHELHVWTADGSFYIGSRADKKVYAQLAYLTTDNVHLLEMAIRKFFKSPKGKLSEAFED